VARRDDEEYVEFVRAVARSLRRTAYLLCGDWQRAEDAVQDALVRVYVAWPRLDRSGGLHSYAHRALVSSALDEAKRPWRRRETPTAAVAESSVPGDTLAELDDRWVVLTALAHLPPRQRACVVLRYYEDRPVDDVARVLGCTSGTVKSQTARGLDALRRRLAETGTVELTAEEGYRS
jgi:RNA polymerase sigma-70 factor (sigma-E family)